MTVPIRKVVLLVLMLALCGGSMSEGRDKDPRPSIKPTDDIHLEITGINSRFVENKQSGRLFVISGNVRNRYPHPRGKIRLRCKLFAAGRILARQESVYAGIQFDESQLRNGSVDEIRKRLSAIPQPRDTDTHAQSEQKLPFMAVFADLPKNMDEFQIETVSSIQVAENGLEPAPGDPSIDAERSQGPEHKIAELVQRTTNVPDDMDAWRQLGNLYFDTHQTAKAIQSYEKSLALGPDQPDVWTDLGVMYRREGQSPKAVQCFDRALSIEPDYQTALFNKGVVLIRDLKDYKGGVAAWQKLVSVNPQARTPRGDSIKEVLEKLQSLR